MVASEEEGEELLRDLMPLILFIFALADIFLAIVLLCSWNRFELYAQRKLTVSPFSNTVHVTSRCGGFALEQLF